MATSRSIIDYNDYNSIKHQLFILFEHASGFALFRTTEFEEVAMFLPQVRESILNISKFRSNVFFVVFQSFKDKKDALQNMLKSAAGEMSSDLQLFLENNVPRSKKSKQPVVLGVEDSDFALEISEKLGIKCLSSGLVIEIIRGIRCHFYKLIKGYKQEELAVKSQLSLAHEYSRVKLSFNVTRQDCMIIESNNLLDEFEHDISTLGKRVRKWYSFHFPELHKILQDDIELYIQCVNIIGNRKELPVDIKESLGVLLPDSSKVEEILSAAHNSMGTEITSLDVENLRMLCKQAISLMNKQQLSTNYLKHKMQCRAPNLSALVGEMIGSKLITRAGGLEKLAKLPASSVLVLGAEKKFFRNLKFRKEGAPICGLLSNSAFMGKAGKKKKGRLARILANKCCLAARVDCFRKSEILKSTFGDQLAKEVEKDIKFVKKIHIKENDAEMDLT